MKRTKIMITDPETGTLIFEAITYAMTLDIETIELCGERAEFELNIRAKSTRMELNFPVGPFPIEVRRD